MAGKVKLIDPNNSNLNYAGEGDNKEFQHNGIPQYQDMYISVELKAVERGRTILTSSLENADITKIHPKSFGKNRTISFLGENQDPDNDAHFGSFTTNWYDGSSEEDKTYEGFGINSIDITTNSSYIPQINIEFIDIRGLAFFNRKNSPYRVLFNFPPPIFYLTVKGYYGKPITYQMHLVKYNSEFKAETGNYHIDANFIAITYAPLTDIPFRYIIQSPFMGDNPESITSDTSKKPNNTLDLIIKLENVYSQTLDRLKTDPENLKYENSQKKVQLFDNQFEKLRGYLTKKPLINGGTPQLFTYDRTRESDETDIQEITGFNEYDEYIKTFSSRDVARKIDKEIHVGFKLDDNLDQIGFEFNVQETRFYNILISFKNQILADAKNISLGIVDSDISDGDIALVLGNEGSEGNVSKYISLNITKYYNKLYKGKQKALNTKIDSINNLNEKINAAIEEKLGMLPTIYNIFEILLNDVDKFFDILRKTSYDAELHHNDIKNKKQIINDGTFKDKRNSQNTDETNLFSFPLVIKQNKICNQIVEERKAPFEISARCDTPFPELNLVQSFIDSFIKYNKLFEQLTLKEEKTVNGNSIWIPFTPADSNFISNVLQTPYLGTDSFDVDNEPINLVETNKLNQIFTILLKRFQLLCQNSIPYSFFNIEGNSTLSDAYINLYARSEAINLSNSIVNENYAKLLKQFAFYNKGNVNSLSNENNGFFTYLENNLSELYNESPDAYSFNLGEDLYRDKTNSLFKGIEIKSIRDVAIRTGGQEGDVNDFIEEESEEFLEKILSRTTTLQGTFDYTTENLVFRGDSYSSKYQTKFLSDNIIYSKFYNKTSFEFFNDIYEYDFKIENQLNEIRFTKFDDIELNATKPINYNINKPFQKRPYPQIYKDIADVGNQYFKQENLYDSGVWDNPSDIDIIEAFSLGLVETGKIGHNVLFNRDSNDFDIELSQLVILSAFGRVLSPFNYYPRSLNSDFFRTPSIVETPRIVLAYLGFLSNIQSGSTTYDKFMDFFENGVGSDIKNKGLFIFADIYDINTYLGERDKTLLNEYYSSWYTSEYSEILSVLNGAYNESIGELTNIFERGSERLLLKKVKKDKKVNVIGYLDSVENLIYEKQFDYIDALLRSDDYVQIFDNLIERSALVIYNELAFKYVYTVNPSNYLSFSNLISTNANSYGNSRTKVEKFFREFFIELHNKLKDREEDLINEKKEFNKKTGDEDISTKTYYSFKNLNDKWLSGFNSNVSGYPFKSDPTKGLVSQFAFVDRAMNPIGDTIIDTKILLDAKDDPNISIFTVISQLLSLNGFEFFPLQNFLSFENDNWENSFKIDTSGIPKQYPVFVCMYIGGASSYPTGINLYGDFEDDGIVDLENPDVGDFLNSDCDSLNLELDDQMKDENIKGNIYSQVRAFRVRYGEQNQSIFYNFAVDSKEYPETNESIQILSRLAGDEGKNAPVPKAQNLYDLYENRSYKATITGFGNAMIQPTQYFQLENVPLYNGAYVILDVNHNITANKMTTKFSGTKLLKYPMPRVLNAATIVGFEGGSTSESSSYEVSDSEVNQGIGTASNPTQTKYLSMYEQKIGR